jgi:hypothetical protein
MKLTIEQSDNGYVLSYNEITEDNDLPVTRYIAVEDTKPDSDIISDARLTQKLLFEICEHFGIFSSKHDAEQLRIVIEDKNGKEID